MAGPSTRAEKIRTVIRVSSGNFLEMYDFFLFGYYAKIIDVVVGLRVDAEIEQDGLDLALHGETVQ